MKPNETAEDVSKRVMIAAGGTGGHIFPALAVAHALQDAGCEIIWVGTPNRMESWIVPAAGFRYESIPVGGLRGRAWYWKLLSPMILLRPLWCAMRILYRYQPDLVLSFGGFVSGPVGLAAYLMRRKLVIHEQNARAGFTNQLLARLASRVLCGFSGTFPQKYGAEVTGNPIRRAFYAVSTASGAGVTSVFDEGQTVGSVAGVAFSGSRGQAAGRSVDGCPESFSSDDFQLPVNGRVNILIIGGSGGAKFFNETFGPVFSQLSAEAGLSIWHQTGQLTYAAAEAAYRDCVHAIQLSEFIENMPAAFSWADLVIARAGALSVSEIAFVGRAAIFIPYPYAVDDHQTANAQKLVDVGAAICIQQSNASESHLASVLQDLCLYPEKLEKMGQLARQSATMNATEQVRDICIKTLHCV